MTAHDTTPAFEEHGGGAGVSSMSGLLPGAKSNALSNKITSVLSASYADSEIRNALGVLNARGTTNTIETRRNLRLDAQKEVIDCNVAILNEFSQVAEQLKRVGAMIATLNDTCDQMRRHIALAKSESAPMLEEASTLVIRKQESETKQAVLDAFTKHFIVVDEDLDVLTSSAVPVNDQFFVVLNRVKKIHDDCEPLLGSENERLGRELMEQTSRNLDAGFKKLYNWVQRALKGLDLEDPQISGSIRRALRVLSERPTLFQNCLEFLAEAREQTLSDAFQMALSGTRDGLGSAIEFSAHDLLRYMGDMLAWVHSTTVSEKESLEGLFIADAEAINRGMKLGKANEPWLQDIRNGGISNDERGNSEYADDNSFDGEKALKELVSRSLSTISATLRERIELAVHQHDDIVLLFKAQNLLAFYHDLFAKLVGPTSALSTTIQRLETLAQEHIYQGLSSDNDTSWVSDPIEGPAHHKENLARMEALFAVKPPDEMNIKQFTYFYSRYVGPSQEYAETVVAAIKDPTMASASDLHLIYCIVSVASTCTLLAKYVYESDASFTKRRTAFQAGLSDEDPADMTPYGHRAQLLHQNRALLETLEKALVDRSAETMLAASGVAELMEQERDDMAMLRSLPDSATKLDNFLSTGYAEMASRLKGVDLVVEESVEAAARDVFLEKLELVMAALELKGGEYRELYPRTMEDVKALIC